MKKQMTRRRKMTLAILGIILGVILITAGILGIRAAVHSKVPNKLYGDYEFSSDMPFDLDLFPSLVIDKDATNLKIMQIADPQIKFGSFPSKDRRTMDLLEKAIKTEKPDLCVVTGDLTLSVFSYDAFKYFADFMQRLDVKWAFVYGNHDSQFDCSKYTISQMLAGYDNCLFAVGPSNVKGETTRFHGESNYLINVFKGEKKAENLAYSLVLLDSGMYPEEENVALSDWVYDWIHQDQIDWYNWAIDGLQAIKPGIQSTAFFHIPVKEFADMYYANELQKGNPIPEAIDASALKQAVGVTGVVRESPKKEKELMDEGYSVGIFYQGKNQNATVHPDIFAAFKAQGSTKAVFCGHDHVNNLKGWYDGIYLAYGLCCGYHTYPFFDKFPSDKVLWNGQLWTDEEGKLMEKGVTLIDISLDTSTYGSFTVVDKGQSQLGK